MTILYGIHNCDTVKKAQKWLTSAEQSFQFHDLRKDGLDVELLNSFANKASWQELINKRSTTYRNLPQDIKDNLQGDVAVQTVLEQPTLLKRPLLLINDALYLGFKAANYQEIFNND